MRNGWNDRGRSRGPGAERTVPIQVSITEGLDIGMDNGSAVDWTYRLPFAFTGRIDKVTVEVKPR